MTHSINQPFDLLTDLTVASSEVFIAIAAMFLLIFGVFQGDKRTSIVSWTAMAFLTVALAMGFLVEPKSSYAFHQFFIQDDFALFLKSIILIGLIATIAISTPSLEIRGIQRFEYPILIMLSGLGMMIMVSSNHLLTLYMGLELQSLCLYVLAALQKGSVKSPEAGLKYFILGALSSGILLFGISLVYGFSGSLFFPDIYDSVANQVSGAGAQPGLITGLVFVLVALAFKISAVPFHMWTPDVYEGAPTPVTALFVMAPKIAAMGLIMRLLFDGFGSASFEWGQILVVLSIASMMWGAFAALVQNNLKRILAYSSIGHIGYALVGLVPGTQLGVSSVLIYLTIYMITSAGVFACLLRLNRDDLEIQTVPELAGLSKTNPFTAYLLVIFMFSMTGLPPLAGFFGKLAVFQAALDSGYYSLAVIGVLTSVVAAYYYLRIIKVMVFDEADEPLDKETAISRHLVASLSAAFAVLFIINPDYLFNLADIAAQSLITGS